MPEITTMTLTDGLAVDHVFTISDKVNGVLELRSKQGGPTFEGHAHQDMVLTVSSKKMSDGGRRIKGKLTVPYEHFDGITDQTPFTQVGEFSFRTSGNSDTANRKDLGAMIGDAINEALIQSTIESNDGVW